MDVMIDIETLGTKPTSLILSIGACWFDPLQQNSFEKLLETSIHMVIEQPEIYDCLLISKAPMLLHSTNAIQKFSIDPLTVEWWLSNQKEGLAALSKSEFFTPLKRALVSLGRYMEGARRVWANSPSFDLAILNNAYKVMSEQTPWKFYEERDLRTLLDIKGVIKKDIKQEGFIPHRADHDAAFQAMLVQIAMNK